MIMQWLFYITNALKKGKTLKFDQMWLAYL